MRKLTWFEFLIATAVLSFPLQAAKKVYISVDMEGISGIATEQMLYAPGSEYARGQKLMADDTNAAIRGAFDGGATEVLVNDSHGSHTNLVPELLDARASLITHTFKRMGMMEGLDDSFDAVIFVGYHAKAGSTRGLFAHTGDANVQDVIIEGNSVGEGGMNELVARWYGVPVVLITGDDVAVAQMKQSAPSVRGVVVKRAINSRSAELFPLERVHREIEEAASAGVKSAAKVTQWRANPIHVSLQFRDVLTPELAEVLPGMQRPAPDTIAFNTDSMPRAYAIIRLLYRWIVAPAPRQGYEY